MHLKTAIARATRAMREDVKLHLIAVSSLTVAFLCLASALLAIANLSSIAEAWGRSGRMTVYLRDGADTEEVERLTLLLEALSEVRAVEHLTSGRARAEFLENAELDAELNDLPAEVFPASLEVELAEGTSPARLSSLAARVGQFGAVEDVETYEDWFGRLDALLTTGRFASIVLALLVLLCVLFVVGSTIRIAIAGRRDEIEVLKLCGASDRFVRGPFLIEGAVQGFISSALAVALLFLAFIFCREQVDSTLAVLAGVRTVFLGPSVVLTLILAGAMVGAAGSVISLRRYLAV